MTPRSTIWRAQPPTATSRPSGGLYDHLVGPIYRYVAMRIRRREDAEDVTHLVFERIVTALPKYQHNGKPFAAWAFRIARNAVIDHQRRARPTEPLGGIEEPTDGIGSRRSHLREEEIRELRAAIRRLTPTSRRRWRCATRPACRPRRPPGSWAARRAPSAA